MSMLLPLLFTAGISGQAVLFIGICIAIGIGFAALFYMLSFLLNHPPLTAMAKEEIAALAVTVIIIGAWFFFQQTMWVVTCSLAFGSCSIPPAGQFIAPTHISVANAALEIVFLKLRSIYVSLYLYEVLIGFLSTVYVPIGTFNPGLALMPVSFPPLVGLSLLSNAHTVLVESIGMTMAAIIAKQQLLNLAQYGVPLILLPIGLVLRSLPWYRTTGSSIIAICIALYFVYPLSIMLSNYMIFDLYKPADFVYAPTTIGFCQAQQGCTKGTNCAEDALVEKASDIQKFREKWQSEALAATGSEEKGLAKELWSVVKAMFQSFTSVADSGYTIFTFMMRLFGDFTIGAFSMLWGGGAHVGVVSGLFYFVTEEVVTVSQFVILVVVTSVFEIIITVTMYRNISALIGGEIEIIGLSRLI